MPTAGQISKDWKCQKSYVQRCIKKGCPTDSFENARDWRTANTTKRPTTSPKQIARLLADEKGDDGPEARERRKAYFAGKPEGTRLPTGDSLNEGLNKAIDANEEAYRLLKEAMIEEKDQKIGVRLGYFNKSSENLFKAESSYREEQERRGILIELAKAQFWARKAFEVMLSRLASLPQNLAVRCNPQNPHMAMDALEEEARMIIEDGRRAIA